MDNILLCYSASLPQEIAIMKIMDHPNILKLYESFEDHKKQNMYSTTEPSHSTGWTSKL